MRALSRIRDRRNAVCANRRRRRKIKIFIAHRIFPADPLCGGESRLDDAIHFARLSRVDRARARSLRLGRARRRDTRRRLARLARFATAASLGDRSRAQNARVERRVRIAERDARTRANATSTGAATESDAARPRDSLVAVPRAGTRARTRGGAGDGWKRWRETSIADRERRGGRRGDARAAAATGVGGNLESGDRARGNTRKDFIGGGLIS